MSSWSVTFTGFKTEVQAKEFAAWYDKQGCQFSSEWLEEHTDLTGAYEDERKTHADTQTVEVALALYEKKKE